MLSLIHISGDFNGQPVPVGAQRPQQFAHAVFVLADQRAFLAAFVAAAEDVQRTAAQALHPRQQLHRAVHPGAVDLLDELALVIGAGQQRRRQMVLQADLAFEHRGDLLRKGRVGVQPRHFVLVLVGHQLEAVSYTHLDVYKRQG